MVCMIQARSTSTRMPGKCCRILIDRPLWKWSYDTCRSVLPTTIVVPETDTEMHKSLTEWKTHFYAVKCPESDVLTRYHTVANKLKASAVVRITSDCPLLPRCVLVDMVDTFRAESMDYLSNIGVYSWVDGWDVQIMSWRLLDHMHKICKGDDDREHVCSYAENNMEKLSSQGYVMGHRPYEWIGSWMPKLSIDTYEDWDRVVKIIRTQRGLNGNME